MSAPVDTSTSFFGHPRGLATLFFTEMWERFSYYGMRALLVLFMTAAVLNQEGEQAEHPGLGFDEGTASAIYGLYTSMVYFLSLAGGWVADNVWGQRKSVFIGGCVIAAGHFSMAVPTTPFFFLGLVLIVIGTGLLKPNISTMVGALYPSDAPDSGPRRDAGFSIFYMGINLGAFLGPLLCGYLGEEVNWHLGFSLAGFGMVAGLIQYKLTEGYLGDAGIMDPKVDPQLITRRAKLMYSVFFASIVLIAIGAYVVHLAGIDLELVASAIGYGVLTIVALYFIYLWVFSGHTAGEKKRIGVIFWLFLLSGVFWAGFEQAGSSMNIFARDFTDRSFGSWEMPASWLQSVNSIFIIIFAPIFGWTWVWLSRIQKNPSTPVKFALGLFGLAGGFFVLAWGAANASATNPVSPSWLVVTYFLHTVGELCLSPVGLSTVTRLAPNGRVGQMMGVWFVATALGNLFAGLVAATMKDLSPGALFWSVALITGGVGLTALILAPVVNWITREK